MKLCRSRPINRGATTTNRNSVRCLICLVAASLKGWRGK